MKDTCGCEPKRRDAVARFLVGAAVATAVVTTPGWARAADARESHDPGSPEPVASLSQPTASMSPMASEAASPPANATADSGSAPRSPTEAAPPMFYAAALVATTLAYRPNGGTLQGPQGDATPLVGFGYLATAQIALELDVGASFGQGGYLATSVTPGVVWAFHPNVYAAGRAIVAVHPVTNLTLYPGIGGTYAFGPVAPFLEINVLSTIGRGDPDLGLGGSAGALYLF